MHVEVRNVATERRVHDPGLDDHLAPLKEGGVSGIFSRNDMHYVLKVLGRRAERLVAYEEAKDIISALPGIPPWGATYLLASLGLEKTLPLDPHTDAVLEELRRDPNALEGRVDPRESIVKRLKSADPKELESALRVLLRARGDHHVPREGAHHAVERAGEPALARRPAGLRPPRQSLLFSNALWPQNHNEKGPPEGDPL